MLARDSADPTFSADTPPTPPWQRVRRGGRGGPVEKSASRAEPPHVRTSWPPRIEIAAPHRRRPALPAGSWPAPGSCGAPAAKGEEPAEAGQVVAAVGARPHGAHRRFARSPLAASSAIGALRAPPRPSVPWSTPAEGRGQQAVGTALCYGGGGAPRRSASKQQSRQCPATTQACHVQPATRRHRWWWAALEGARAAAGRPVDARATRTTQPCVRSRAARLGLVRPLE